MDPADLPCYAGRVHDHVTKHPERLRLMKWGQLELGSERASVDDPFNAVVRNKIDQLRQAQTDGVLDASWDPSDILDVVSQLATSAVDPGGSIDSKQRTTYLAARHDAIEHAVQRLFPASTSRRDCKGSLHRQRR